MKRVAAIVPAAGRGRRMGSPINKTFLSILGKPILAYTLTALQTGISGLEHIIVAIGPDEEETFRQTVQPHLRPRPEVLLVIGGDDRQTSVYRALECVPPNIDLILVHDGARPLVSPQVIRRCLEAAEDGRCAVAAIPAKDTLKLIDEDYKVYTTLPRDQVWHIQTPQVFPRGVLVDAHRQALATGFVGYDDASLVERLGIPVYVVMGDERNIKVTHPTDMIVAAALMKATDNEWSIAEMS